MSEFYIDTLQVQHVYNSLTTEGIVGMPVQTVSDWNDINIVEADSY